MCLFFVILRSKGENFPGRRITTRNWNKKETKQTINEGTYAPEKKYVYFINLPCTKSKNKILWDVLKRPRFPSTISDWSQKLMPYHRPDPAQENPSFVKTFEKAFEFLIFNTSYFRRIKPNCSPRTAPYFKPSNISVHITRRNLKTHFGFAFE